VLYGIEKYENMQTCNQLNSNPVPYPYPNIDLQVTWVFKFQLTSSFLQLTSSLSHLFLLKLTWNIMSLTFNLARKINILMILSKMHNHHSWTEYQYVG